MTNRVNEHEYRSSIRLSVTQPSTRISLSLFLHDRIEQLLEKQLKAMFDQVYVRWLMFKYYTTDTLIESLRDGQRRANNSIRRRRRTYCIFQGRLPTKQSACWKRMTMAIGWLSREKWLFRRIHALDPVVYTCQALMIIIIVLDEHARQRREQ